MSYQEITIVGFLGRDPEMRYTPGGSAVTSFPLAANRRHRDAQGELVKETTWFQVTAWERQAENAAQYLQKGSQVLVRGRLNPDSQTGGPRLYERRDGSAGASYEVTAREIIYLSGRESSNGSVGSASAASGAATPLSPDDLVDIDIPF
jgi:single-strand DNA-binding protein